MNLDKPAIEGSGYIAAHDTVAAPKRVTHQRSPWMIWFVIFGLIAIGAFLWWRHAGTAPPVKAPPPVPVEGAVVRKGDLQIYLNQIGTVTPFATVTLKSRVAGQIMKLGFKEGETVTAGQTLFSIDSRPYQATLDQDRGQLARDQATLVNARITLARDQKLFKEGVIAAQDLDNQRATYEQAIGTIANDRGLIEAAQVNLDYCKVTAPITGRIGLRDIDLGNYVSTTDNLAVITQLQPISVIFSVPEDSISSIVKDIASHKQVPVQAWNRDFSSKIADGFLLTFDNQVDQSTGTVKLRAQFANNDYKLFPDQFVNARLLLNTLNDVTLVPNTAIQSTQQGSNVYVVQPNQTVARREIKIRAQQGNTVAIANGVNPGDVVVTDGLDKLSPGSHVNVDIDQTTPTTSPVAP